MLSVDASGGVHVGVNPLHPFADRPPTRRESFGVRMVKKGRYAPAAWRTEGALRHAQSLLNPHSISTAPKKALAGPKDSEIRVSGCAKFQIQRNKEHGPFSDCYHLTQNKKRDAQCIPLYSHRHTAR